MCDTIQEGPRPGVPGVKLKDKLQKLLRRSDMPFSNVCRGGLERLRGCVHKPHLYG
jgi:hypothetical protein